MFPAHPPDLSRSREPNSINHFLNLVATTTHHDQLSGDDRNRHFRTEHLQADLGGRSARGRSRLRTTV